MSLRTGINPEESTLSILTEKQVEKWDSCISRLFTNHIKCRETGVLMNNLMWERVGIIGEVSEYFGDQNLRDFSKGIKSVLTEDVAKQFNYQKVLFLKKMYDTYLRDGDRRVESLSYMHHIYAANTDNPFYWLSQAAKHNWGVPQMHSMIGREKFMKAMVEGGYMKQFIGKFANRFVKTGPHLGFFLSELISYIQEFQIPQELEERLSSVKEWADNERGFLELPTLDETKDADENFPHILLSDVRVQPEKEMPILE